LGVTRHPTAQLSVVDNAAPTHDPVSEVASEHWSHGRQSCPTLQNVPTSQSALPRHGVPPHDAETAVHPMPPSHLGWALERHCVKHPSAPSDRSSQ